MGDKKRKATPVSTDLPAKKSKKSRTATDEDISKTQVTKPAEKPDKASHVQKADVAVSKKSRKHAVDFMSDDEATADQSKLSSEPKKIKHSTPVEVNVSTVPDLRKKRKNKKNKKEQHDELLSADGVNGVVEHEGREDLETATSHKPVASSMQAEAERTVDQELKDDFGGFSEGQAEEAAPGEIETEDNAAVLLAGFDSDGEDQYEDENLDTSSKLKLSKKKDKEVREKLSQVQHSGSNEGPGTVYVGRIPHGFYEKEMHEYFSQFGEISKLRLSRNKHTGASKHFAFIEFSSNEVAKIVSETMDNYLLFGHLLKCKYAQPDSLHPDTWKGANKKFRKIPHEKLERERLAAPKTEVQWDKKNAREKKKRNRKARQLEALGLELPASTLKKSSEALKQRQLEHAKEGSLLKNDDSQVAPTGAIKALNGLPKDELAILETTKSENLEDAEAGKKSKRSKNSKKNKTILGANAEATSVALIEDAQEVKKAIQGTAGKVVSGNETTDPVISTTEEFIALAADEEHSDSVEEPVATKGKVKAGEKKKKDRKNITKARGPKSAITSAK
ncbi:uncharacterized protein A1O9_08064 [Exophiala aquamarina CBS 119918]|uniref:RRM domain-containing protein n=1 Tax=Exophiala aquamarina CBS 119918 TaxID=1182545 RepID=A0A072PB23_9EURO|nr:uncharacterized protein A1O9_08064 [Exophiala aquamarina CBS 119918]KEF56483.1 hypothetical protein A1O9_08064 [Exophiala aquamarina CBS 119918]